MTKSFFQIGIGYVLGHTVYEIVREKPMKKLGLRKDGGLSRGVGKGAYDFSLAMSLGSLFEFTKYYGVNTLLGEKDSSK